jgi:hypothetical protein
MERYLMDHCVNHDSETCQPEIKNARRATEIKDGKIPLWPSGKEQAELDKICEKCASRYFEISNYICPVCHGSEFRKVVSIGDISEGDCLKAKVTIMQCAECKSKVRLVEQF